jgi:iron(III) transport system ATP-binding protein
MTVAENVAFPLMVRGMRDTREAVGWALDVVGLGALSKRLPSELSGGQQQRVALARAIAGRPKVLLFDEPLSNLDARLRDRTRAEISRIQKDLSIPAVYVTHDQAEALSMSDRVIVMDSGRIVEIGEPRTLYRRPASRFTADFIGAANFLSLVYRDHAWRAPDGSSVRLADPTPGSTGETREAVLRSEIISVRAAADPVPHDSVNALRGTIKNLQYMGSHIDYLIDVSGVTLNALSSEEFAKGAAVFATFRPQDVHLLPKLPDNESLPRL